MTAHEPINYLDSVLSEEEKRCEYSHQWRNFTISRSGRFKSKNKKRDVVNGQLFDGTMDESGHIKEDREDKHNNRQASTVIKSPQHQTTSVSSARVRDKMESYKSYYETNL